MSFFNYLKYSFIARPQPGTLWIALVFGLLITISACDSTSSVTPYQGQTFIKLYGGNGSEEGKDLVLLPDGGFVMVGSSTSESAGGKDVYVLRADDIGNVVWEKKFGSGGDDIGNSVILGQDNSLYICGELTDTSTFNLFRDVYVLNISVDNGSLIGEEHTYGDSLRDEFGRSILDITGSNGFLITATWAAVDTSSFFMVETDGNLNAIPTRSNYVYGTKGTHNYSTKSFERTVGSTFDPPFICFGSVLDDNISTTIYQSFEYRPTNDVGIDPERYGSDANNEFCTDVFATTDGGYILTGDTDLGSYSKEMVVKIGPDRHEVWKNVYSNVGEGNIKGGGIIQTQDGGYMVSATIELADPENDEISLLKLNPLGEEEWRNTYGSNDDDVGSKLVQLEDGSYVVVGTIGFDINPDSRSKMCLMKVTSEGSLVPID